MIPPNQGSSLFQDLSPNRTPRENRYISGYEGPNKIFQDVPNMVQIVPSMVNISDPEGETVTCGSLYKFAMLNIPEIRHLQETLISPNW